MRESRQRGKKTGWYKDKPGSKEQAGDFSSAPWNEMTDKHFLLHCGKYDLKKSTKFHIKVKYAFKENNTSSGQIKMLPAWQKKAPQRQLNIAACKHKLFEKHVKTVIILINTHSLVSVFMTPRMIVIILLYCSDTHSNTQSETFTDKRCQCHSNYSQLLVITLAVFKWGSLN